MKMTKKRRKELKKKIGVCAELLNLIDMDELRVIFSKKRSYDYN